jgi:hypothetical protein
VCDTYSFLKNSPIHSIDHSDEGTGGCIKSYLAYEECPHPPAFRFPSTPHHCTGHALCHAWPVLQPHIHMMHSGRIRHGQACPPFTLDKKCPFLLLSCSSHRPFFVAARNFGLCVRTDKKNLYQFGMSLF